MKKSKGFLFISINLWKFALLSVFLTH